jgi:NAD dependent epimerase/dehydratase family enzyme
LRAIYKGRKDYIQEWETKAIYKNGKRRLYTRMGNMLGKQEGVCGSWMRNGEQMGIGRNLVGNGEKQGRSKNKKWRETR